MTQAEKTRGSDGLPDLLVAAYAHEIGHAAVALWFGCEVRVEVEFTIGTRHFDGTCHVRHPAGDLAACVLRPVGLAGVVAELAYRFGWDSPRLSVEAMSDALRAGQLDISQTDLQMADGWTGEDMALAFEVIGDRWEWIVSEAEGRAREAHGALFEAAAAIPTNPRPASATAGGNRTSAAPG